MIFLYSWYHKSLAFQHLPSEQQIPFWYVSPTFLNHLSHWISLRNMPNYSSRTLFLVFLWALIILKFYLNIWCHLKLWQYSLLAMSTQFLCFLKIHQCPVWWPGVVKVFNVSPLLCDCYRVTLDRCLWQKNLSTKSLWYFGLVIVSLWDYSAVLLSTMWKSLSKVIIWGIIRVCSTKFGAQFNRALQNA